MADQKKVKVVLNTAGDAVDATASTVSDSGTIDSIKQRLPFLREKDTAIVGESTLNLMVGEVVAAGAVMYVGDKLDVAERVNNLF